MGWLSDLVGGGSGGGVFGTGSIWDGSSGGNFGGGGGWSISDLWGDIGQPGSITDNLGWLSGNGGGGIWDWASGLSGGGGSGLAGLAGQAVGGLLQGGGQQGGGLFGQNSQGLMGSLLAGLGGAADAYLGEKAMRERGKQDRLSIGYAADLQDYYGQLNKQRKRIALDTYGQFSLLNGGTNAPAVQVPAKPNPGG